MPQPISTSLAEICDPTLPANALTAALRTLKNDIVGHEQRKELVIRQGIVPRLTNVLSRRRNESDTTKNSARHSSVLGSGLTQSKEGSPFYSTTKANGKRRSGSETGTSRGKMHSRRKSADLLKVEKSSGDVVSDLHPGLDWTDEDEVKLQATLLVGSLGHGGPTFISPLIAGGIAAPLLSACNTSVHPRLLTATLETLLVLSNIIAFRQSRIDTTDSPIDATEQDTATAFTQEIYSKHSVESFVDILAQLYPAPFVGKRILLVTQLIARTCRSNKYRDLLVRVGALDQLVARFAATAITVNGNKADYADLGLPPAVERDGLFLLLEAIATIIQYSDYRTARFLYSPDVLSVFASSAKYGGDANSYMRDQTTASKVLDTESRMEFSLGVSLPQIQAAHVKGDKTHQDIYPVNYTMHGFSDQLRTGKAQQGMQRAVNGKNDDGLVAWLISLARSERRFNRLITIWILTLVTGVMEKISITTRTEYTFKNLDRSLALLIVPLLMNLIDESNAAHIEQKQLSSSTPWPSPLDGALSTHTADLSRSIKESAPTVLAALIEGSPTLQKAAVEAGAIKKLCQALKKTFDPTSCERKSLWTPIPTNSTKLDTGDNLSTTSDVAVGCTIARPGHPGLSPETLHALKCRRSTLQALAAIANKEDAYRKIIIENGIVSCIIDSLVPFPDERSAEPSQRSLEQGRHSSAREGNAADKNTNGVLLNKNNVSEAKGGNPVPVLVGACNVARAMSRSVSILRTSLIDAGIARPIYNLVKHPNEEVQIAATNVMCNLLLEVSPMREELIEAGAMETLCTHAHKLNPSIREISLWALKHLILAAPNEIRINCLNRLGPQWLMQIIDGGAAPKSASHFDATFHNGHSQPQLGMGTPNAAGEQVDLLNAVENANDIGDDYIMHSDDDLEENHSDMDSAPEGSGSARQSMHRNQKGSQSGTERVEVPKLNRTWSSILRQLSPPQQMLLRTSKLSEQDSSLLARSDNLRAQEQGLDFIRNLITSKGAFEMIDHVMSALSSYKFFEVLCSKLTPKMSEQSSNPLCTSTENSASASPGTLKSSVEQRSSNDNNDGLTFQGHYHQRQEQFNRIANISPSRPGYGGSAGDNASIMDKHLSPSGCQIYSHQRQNQPYSHYSRQSHQEQSFQQNQQLLNPTYHQQQQQRKEEQQRYILHRYQFPELLLTTVFILVHIAAGTPRHRSILISEQTLLRSVLPLFSHTDRRLRVACVWLVSNLTWVDNASDTPAARIRALELRALGFEERLRVAASDPELDVRERAKTALDQCAKLLGGPPLSTSGNESGPNTNPAPGTASAMTMPPTLPMNISTTSHPATSMGGAMMGPVFGSYAPGTSGATSGGATGPTSGTGNMPGSGRPTFE